MSGTDVGKYHIFYSTLLFKWFSWKRMEENIQKIGRIFQNWILTGEKMKKKKPSLIQAETFDSDFYFVVEEA